MIAVEFDEVNVRIAENQPEFETLPAHHNPKDGSVTFCFQLNKEELAEIAKTGKVFFKQIVGPNKMQPISMSTLKSDLI